jgi:hypothetical protein
MAQKKNGRFILRLSGLEAQLAADDDDDDGCNGGCGDDNDDI